MSFDRIVIGIDEASVLFSKPSRSHYDGEVARELVKKEISKIAI